MRRLPPALAVMLTLLPASGTADAAEPWTPYHSRLPAGDTLVHYVHLTLKLDPDKEAEERQHVLDDYEGCKLVKKMMAVAGEPAGPLAELAPESVPAVIHHGDLEIYYGRDRTLTVQTWRQVEINRWEGPGSSDEQTRRADCSLTETRGRKLTFFDATRECEVDPYNRTLRSARTCPGTPLAAMAPTAHLPRYPTPPLTAANPYAGPTGQSKTIAGLSCQVFGASALGHDCIANPPGPFPIPAASFHKLHPGILLESRFPPAGRTHTAQEVRLELKVDASLFKMPSGLRLGVPGPIKNPQ